MPHASASAPASSLPLRSQRARVSVSAARSTFADALTYAFDIAFRAPESLSLAQRAAYGLERHKRCDGPRQTQLGYVAGQTKLGETPRPHRSTMKVDRSMMQLFERNAPNNAPNVVGRAQLGEQNAPNVVRRAQLGDMQLYETARPRRSTIKVDRSIANVAHPYFTFNARAGGAEITFVVANGRAFAGVRSWTR